MHSHKGSEFQAILMSGSRAIPVPSGSKGETLHKITRRSRQLTAWRTTKFEFRAAQQTLGQSLSIKRIQL